MTWKEKRIVTILLSIITVLFAALLIVLGFRYRAAREAAVGGATIGAAPSSSGKNAVPQSYTAISYDNGSATLSFTLDEQGAWIWADDPDFPLDDLTVASIADELSSLHFQQTLPAGESMAT